MNCIYYDHARKSCGSGERDSEECEGKSCKVIKPWPSTEEANAEAS